MSEASVVIPAQAGIQKNKSLEGWQFLPIKDFAHTTSGGTPKRGVAEYYNGDVPWVKSGDLNDSHLNQVDEYITKLGLEKSSAKLFKPGTLLIALYGATIGRLSILNFEASTNQAVCGISVPENVDVKYLFYYLLSIRQKLIDQGKGGAQPNINQQIVKETVVPLAPPEQQKRIVAKIEELFSHIDAGIQALKKAKQLLKQYRQSVLKAAVTGELTKEWREANKDKLEPASQLLESILIERRQKWEQQQLEQFKAKGKIPKDDNWKEKYKEPILSIEAEPDNLPDSWAWFTVEQLNPPDRPCAYGVLQPGPEYENGIKLIRVGDIQDGRIVSGDIKKINPEIANKYPRTKLQGGEVLISLVGAIGRTAVVPSELAGSNTARAVGMMALLDGILPEWIELWFRNPSKILEMTNKSHEVARKTLNLEDVRSSSVAIPSCEEQKVVVAIVEEKFLSIRRLEEELDHQLVKAERNKQAVLASAFTGQI